MELTEDEICSLSDYFTRHRLAAGRADPLAPLKARVHALASTIRTQRRGGAS